ncbi:MAG TPA: protein kinase [Bryobacteraceae bacterium]|nr:protein kinase [Bryobacteraceae bacterium]
MIGDLLGHYRILAKLGQGGMGFVYRAHDEVLHRDVAVKVVSSSEVTQESSRKFLLHEARASSALNHPNICTIFEVGERMGELFIVMELVEGQSLSALIGSNGLPVQTVLRYGTQIAAALAHAHSRNVVHRDLKSSNLVVTPAGLVKVLDFGLARRLPVEMPASEVTQTVGDYQGPDSVGGTLPYMAPEVLRGEPGDYRSDLWALGIVLYEAATGKLPFSGKTGFETSSAILHDLPPPVPARIPPGLWAIIQRCLIKEPAQRYQQASEVQAALEAVQSASMVTPEAPPTDQRGPVTTVHRGIKALQVKNGDQLLMVGTTKGLFLLRPNAQRSRWDVAGPYFHGHAIYALAFDGRAGRRRLWAATNSMIWGAFLRSSDDFGRTWTNPQEANIKFPADSGTSLKNIWQIQLGRDDQPDLLYCGVEPAALFKSHDAGETWSLVRGLFDHPHRPRWMPGFGGLALHTILPDPAEKDRIYVAISAGGAYVTNDACETWQAVNKGVRVVFAPERYPEFGQCVHKIVQHPARPERLFLQNHWGLYRSDNCGETWQDIANAVPSDFGFAMAMHPHDPDCVYIVPMESDEFRVCPEGRLRVYRTRNAGESWEALSRGLPQKGAYETVLRDSMAMDTEHPAGVYFGTRSGQLFGSIDEGKNWKRLLEGLPPVICVKTARVGEPRVKRVPVKKITRPVKR